METITSSTIDYEMVCKLQHYCGLPQRPLEVKLEHGFLCHHINGSPKINKSVWDNGSTDVDINYRASRV